VHAEGAPKAEEADLATALDESCSLKEVPELLVALCIGAGIEVEKISPEI
jgi:hypothetical protein